jgi:hypothetical protein
MDKAARRARVIGWHEEADFPDWGIRRVPVKIDTGAHTSALDVTSYELRHTSGGELIAELRLALHRKRPQRVRLIKAPVLKMVVVSNSSGMREHRPLIETRLALGGVTKLVQLTITNRSGMRFPVILGRKALKGDFLVDVSRRDVLRRKKKSAQRTRRKQSEER